MEKGNRVLDNGCHSWQQMAFLAIWITNDKSGDRNNNQKNASFLISIIDNTSLF